MYTNFFTSTEVVFEHLTTSKTKLEQSLPEDIIPMASWRASFLFDSLSSVNPTRTSLISPNKCQSGSYLAITTSSFFFLKHVSYSLGGHLRFTRGGFHLRKLPFGCKHDATLIFSSGDLFVKQLELQLMNCKFNRIIFF